MFYSQFILAKKGPLGTIWIAAHLERKLRKNQVADTDIGVSVDSILFPEVPIALRLSSHLLLGVVRIYSRKVNYLFHDCSEALLKIKQAFRSTAVDLPPEESTAPYHSITLPETFDLDDFELPDNALFQGNFVDHHVSTREQITLQETMDGMAYPSTSQFGLDERFGDGDASQIGLDVDEELFLKNVSSGNDAAALGLQEDVDPETSGQPARVSKMDIDGIGTSKYQPALLASGCADNADLNIIDARGAHYSAQNFHYNIQTPDLNEEFFPCEPMDGLITDSGVMDFSCGAGEVLFSNSNESAQAPSTPGLMTEAAPSLNLLKKTSPDNSVEVVTDKPNSESLLSDSTDLVREENLGNPQVESDFQTDGTKCVLDSTVNDPKFLTSTENESTCVIPQHVQIKDPGDPRFPLVVSSDMIQLVASPTSVLGEPKSVQQVPESSGNVITEADGLSLGCGQDRQETLENGTTHSAASITPSTEQLHNSELSMEYKDNPSGFSIVSPACYVETSTLQDGDKPLDIDENIVATRDKTSNSLASSEVAPAPRVVDKAQNNINSNGEALSNAGPIDVMDSTCSPTSAFTPDGGFQLGSKEKEKDENTCSDILVLQPCSSSANKPNTFPLEDVVSVEIVPDLMPVKGGLHTTETQENVASNINVASAELQGSYDLLQNVPDLMPIKVGLHHTETQENVVSNVDGASAELPGENCRSHDVAGSNVEFQETQSPMPSEFGNDFNKTYENLVGVNEKDNPMGESSITASELPAPETLLSAPAETCILRNDSVLQSAAGETVAEGEVTVEKFVSLSGKKRRVMESTPVLENGNSSKLFPVTRYRRSMDCVPGDDDVLASILVGKRTPFLKMRPSPTPVEVVSSKRSRVTPRVSLLKRKVLLDDTMVLHGDVIRKQLTNTEDIRRIRRKAPCTRKEIWMIQKYILEEEIFNESLCTGMSEALTGLHNQTYNSKENDISPNEAKQSHLEVFEELEFAERPQLVKETGLEVAGGSGSVLQDRNDNVAVKPIETVAQIENQTPGHANSSTGCDFKEQAEAAMEIDLPEKGPSDVANDDAADVVEMPSQNNPLTRDDRNLSAESNLISELRVASLDHNDRMQIIAKNDGSCLSTDQKPVIEPVDVQREVDDERLHLTNNFLNDTSVADTADKAVETVENNGTSVFDEGVKGGEIPVDETKSCTVADIVPPSFPRECLGDVKEDANDEVFVPLPDNSSVETGRVELSDLLTANMKPSVPDMVLESGPTEIVFTDEHGTGGLITIEASDVVGDEIVAKELANDDGDPITSFVRMEEPQITFSCLSQLGHGMENRQFSEGHDTICQQDYCESVTDTDIPITSVAVEEPGDFDHMLDENDTDFLNVDDETNFVEEEDKSVPTADEDGFIDNSGWSSRTRAVAKYLRTLFDNGTGRGMKMVPVDSLLAGKTRKEASRMFFETLVLKTKDYIHIEQVNPFEKIIIQPEGKLLKPKD